MRSVIGIVGPIASGKGVVVSLLREKGYTPLSLSDIVREKTKEWDLPITRENLQNVGDALRKKFGPTILAELIGQYIQDPNKKFVIDSIRNPAEALYLKKHFGCYLFGITASPQKRFSYMQQREREYDPKTWDEFVQVEERDRGIGQEENGQQVEACLLMADVVFENNDSQAALEKTLSYFLEKNHANF